MIKGKLSKLLMTVAFVEGASLMATEVISAKLIAPYYGTSLYVWTSVLGVTLGGIAMGYLIGGKVSERHPTKKALLIILAVSTILLLILPYTSHFIMSHTVNSMGVIGGTLVSTVFFLFPSIVFFGMVAPMITQMATAKLEDAGKTAGTVYGITTLGGITATLVVGLYLAPFAGLRMSCLLMGGAMALVTLWFYFYAKDIEIPAINKNA